MNWAWQGQLLGYGLLAGVLGGLLGIGGGVIYVVILPAILLSMGVSQTELVSFTVANSLFSTVFTTLSANIKQAFDKNFHLRTVTIISAIGILTSLLLLQFFVNTPYYSKTLFDILFVGMIGFMMVRLVLKSIREYKVTNPVEVPSESLGSLVVTGLIAGAVSPLTGLGGGVVLVPILHSFLHFPIKQANGISLGVIGLTAFASSVFNMTGSPQSHVHLWQWGYIIFPVVMGLSIGGMVGAIVGINISKKLRPQLITLLFAAFLLVILTKKLIEIF